jgi:hypothetical protein
MRTMNKFVAIGLGAAAVVVALLVGAQLLGSPSAPSAGAEPTATAQVTPDQSSPFLSEGELAEGSSHVIWDGAAGGAKTTVTIPAAGWWGQPGGGLVTKNNSGADPPDGAGIIFFMDVASWSVPADPCAWESSLPDEPATSADELVAALETQADRDATAPVDVTVDGRAGTSITLHVPEGIDLHDCDRGTFCTLALTADGLIHCWRFNQGAGQIDVLSIVDVDGIPVVIDAAHYEATPPEWVTEMEAIVDSTIFD